MTSRSTSTIRIATRKSPLALWQAEAIRDALLALHTDLAVELLPMSTRGDKILDAPLAKIGGKGLFVKELEAALLDGRADIAVHSTKDVPMHLPEGLHLGIICQREDPHDALVLPSQSERAEARTIQSINDLPQGAVIGTSSLRRQCQLQQLRPDLQFKSLRGNVNTRLAKLDSGEFDAIVLAAAGLRRLGFADRISVLLAPDQLLPAVGQGALSIELRSDDKASQALLQPLHDPHTAACVLAERAMNRRLNGGCQVPIAGFAHLSGFDNGNLVAESNGSLSLEGRVGAIDGSRLLIESETVDLAFLAQTGAETPAYIAIATQLGETIAERLLSRGAQALLDEVYENQ